MDHPFLSKRTTIEHLRHAIRCVDDMLLLNGLTPDDRAKIRTRCDNDIHEPMRTVILRHSSSLGKLYEFVQAVCVQHHIPVDAKACGDWQRFLQGEVTEFSVSDSLRPSLVSCLQKLSHIEHDDGASTSSDYSDEESDSRDDGSGSTDGESEEETSTDEEGGPSTTGSSTTESM